MSAHKQSLLGKAAENFLADTSRTAQRDAFDAFCREKADWLEDYALFMACKGA